MVNLIKDGKRLKIKGTARNWLGRLIADYTHIGEMQTKAIMSYCPTPVRVAITKKTICGDMLIQRYKTNFYLNSE